MYVGILSAGRLALFERLGLVYLTHVPLNHVARFRFMCRRLLSQWL